MIVEPGHDYVLQVLPSWILTAHVDKIVTDLNTNDHYVVLTQCVWVERVRNFIELMDAEDPHTIPELRCHLFPNVRHVRVTAITQADPMRRLLDRSINSTTNGTARA